MLLLLNKLFKKPVHPFNMQNENVKTYAEWQFEKGEKTVEFYTKKYTLDEMFHDKSVLDIGCGAGGKSLYYASCGASHVTGIDIVPRYAQESAALSQKLGLQDKFTFVQGDAANLPFPDDSFDTIIMNDAMEHVDKPEAVLDDCLRVLRPGGKVFINFPPYNHPYGAHLSDAIGIPWVHLFFTKKSLIKGYKKLVKNLPDGKQRIEFRISKDENGKEYFSYINKMTIKRFKKIIKDKNIVHYHEAQFIKTPVFKEFLTRMVICVIEKRPD